MNPKHERYLKAKREGKSINDCVKAALPGCDPKSKRFKDWVDNAETSIPELKDMIDFEDLNKPKKAPAKKAPATEGE